MNLLISLAVIVACIAAVGCSLVWLMRRQQRRQTGRRERMWREFWESHGSENYIDWSRAQQVEFPNLRRSNFFEENCSYDIFVWIQEKLQLSRLELAKYAEISQRTLERRKKQRCFTLTEWNKLNRYKDLFEFAVYVLETEDNARHWLKSPKKVLGDKVPLEVAKTQDGAKLVHDTLDKIEYGVFA